FFQAEDGIRDLYVTGVQTCALPICNILLGFGASAIGLLPQGYVQNEVRTRGYSESIASGRLATVKGYGLTGDDRLRAEIIERIRSEERRVGKEWRSRGSADH